MCLIIAHFQGDQVLGITVELGGFVVNLNPFNCLFSIAAISIYYHLQVTIVRFDGSEFSMKWGIKCRLQLTLVTLNL